MYKYKSGVNKFSDNIKDNKQSFFRQIIISWNKPTANAKILKWKVKFSTNVDEKA